MILKETDSNTNKDISSAVSIASYTATAVRTVMVRVLINQVAGNGDYIAYITLTKGGVEYRIIPLTTANAASGLTSIGFVSIGIPVDVDDVLQVYVDGLAGDNATPDTRVDWYEMDYLRPTTSGRTLDVAATGEVGLDFTNRLDPTGILPNAAAGAASGLAIVGSVMGKSPATLAPADVSGNLPADLRAIEGALTNGNNATLKLAGLDIRGPAESVVTVYIEGGSGAAAGGYGVYVVGGTNASGTGGDAVFIAGGNGTDQGGAGVSVAGGSGTVSGNGIGVLGENGVLLSGIGGYALSLGLNGVIHGSVDGLNDLTAQEVRNAMALANTVGPVAGSIDKHLDDAPSMAYLDAALTPIAKDSHVDELETRLSATRAAYLDNLAGGAVALNSTVAKDATVAKAATALSNLVWTDAKAGYITGTLALEATLTAIKGAGWTTETLSAIDTLIDAIKAKTDLLPADPTSAATLTAQLAALNDPSVVEIDAQLTATHGAGSWVDVPITSDSVTYTVTVDGLPRGGVYVRMTSDAAGVVNVDAGLSDAAGHVVLHHSLPSGTTVYIWRILAGVSFTDPDTEVIP